ncbi:MAG: type II toxin-antitoxin system RelE/ParE family toxin [Pyrinomonadaceae bacterium]
MIEIRQTVHYKNWFESLRDRNARSRIDTRIRRLSLGNPGDVKSVGSGISELRIDYGPGYRVYFTRRGDEFILLIIGGDKSSQQKDIAMAKKIAVAL